MKHNELSITERVERLEDNMNKLKSINDVILEKLENK